VGSHVRAAPLFGPPKKTFFFWGYEGPEGSFPFTSNPAFISPGAMDLKPGKTWQDLLQLEKRRCASIPLQKHF